MEILWHKNAIEDYKTWQNSDAESFNHLNMLLKECLLNPFSGKGNPRQLKGALTNYWSRRINDEHRIVYKIHEGNLVIIQCRYH